MGLSYFAYHCLQQANIFGTGAVVANEKIVIEYTDNY